MLTVWIPCTLDDVDVKKVRKGRSFVSGANTLLYACF